MKQARYCLALLLCIALPAFAAAPKLENIGAFTGAGSEPIKAAVEASGFRVLDGDGKTLCELWPAKSVSATRQTADVLFPDLNTGAFVGVISFAEAGKDFRGQAIRPGTYTLRYALIPKDANHLGATQDPDFLVLSPVTSDTDPAKTPKFDELVQAGRQAAGTQHPAALAMTYQGETIPAVFIDDHAHVVLAFKTKLASGKDLPLGLIVKGQAEQ
jgi:hypothetical protein